MTREFQSNPQSLRNWTARAGTFLEESRAFIDKYLVNRELPDTAIKRGDDTIESSGATSGDDVWETPTSGGEYDDANTFGGTTDHSQMVGPVSGIRDTKIFILTFSHSSPQPDRRLREMKMPN